MEKEQIMIMVSSVTYAIRGRDFLRQQGYEANIERSPGTMDRVGCGYSIVTNCNEEKARETLQSNNIKIGGIMVRDAA